MVPGHVNQGKIAENAATALLNRFHVEVHDIVDEVRITMDPMEATTVVVHLYLSQRQPLCFSKQENQLEVPHFFPAGGVLIHKVPVQDSFAGRQVPFQCLKKLVSRLLERGELTR